MSKTLSRIIITGLAVCLTAGIASADMQVYLGNTTLGNTNGGVYHATETLGSYLPRGMGPNFDTFCVEYKEYLHLGRTYSLQISDRALFNGGGPTAYDPLDPRTAYLYSQWLDGAYTRNATNADAFQRAIWWVEGEAGGQNSGLSATLINDANTAVAVGGTWYNKWGADSIGDIRIINLFARGHAGEYDYRKQDLLVRVPTPGAMLLGGIGLALVSRFRRRFA